METTEKSAKIIIEELLNFIEPIDFEASNVKNNGNDLKEKKVVVIEKLLEKFEILGHPITQIYGEIFIFNGTYWDKIEMKFFQNYLSKVAEKCGIRHLEAAKHDFKVDLWRQFDSCIQPVLVNENGNHVKINIKNGTLVIDKNSYCLNQHEPKDLFMYKLGFDFDPEAKAPKFCEFLNKVVPDKTSQDILSEFIGYIFLKNLKLEKALMLIGKGANGKSVFFDVIMALIGKNNCENFSMQNLTNENGYYRAKLANKLVNATSELSSKMNVNLFKALVSGEPVDARLPHKEPIVIYNYARIMFNTNELPKDIENTDGFFRRFLIVPFEVQIPPNEQDPELAQKIISEELPGVLNWVLDGLKRLQLNKKFSVSSKSKDALEDFKLQSDSVRLFINDLNYSPSLNSQILLKDVYNDYKSFCNESGLRPFSNKKLLEKFKNQGMDSKRVSYGNVIYCEKIPFENEEDVDNVGQQKMFK